MAKTVSHPLLKCFGRATVLLLSGGIIQMAALTGFSDNKQSLYKLPPVNYKNSFPDIYQNPPPNMQPSVNIAALFHG